MGEVRRSERARSGADTGDTPDGYVYRDDDGLWRYLCADCLGAPEAVRTSFFSAWTGLRDHLWASHAIRRAWVTNADPGYVMAVRLALPIVIAHNTTRHDGG